MKIMKKINLNMHITGLLFIQMKLFLLLVELKIKTLILFQLFHET